MRQLTRTTGILGAILFLMLGWSAFLSTSGSHAADSQTLARVADAPARRFEFTYQVHVPAIPDSRAPLHIWIPLPSTDAWQTITDLKIESPVAYQIKKENQFGNRMAYSDVKPHRAQSAFDITVRFAAVRREHRVDLVAAETASNAPLAKDASVSRFLQPDRLVPINGVIGDLSKEHTDGATTPLDKARAIYEYVVATMKYDKSGTGWGHGDAIWACTSKRGNCTDFHSLFDGMARAAGIPARFEVGFPLPEDKTQADIPGYHCWTEFYLNGVGWVPIDASEAWKHPAKHDYFFGANDVNRIQFSIGRDIRLNPPQSGDPLNYFVYPYAELNGKPFDQLQTHFSFRDLMAPEPRTATAKTPE
jgi:transglutaminase-like putative cysteine protease